MALTPSAMECGDGVELTDDFGGCNSYAYTTIDTDARFLGPKFSIFFRFQRLSGATSTGSIVVGCANSLGAPRRFWVYQIINGGEFHVGLVVDTDACGFMVVDLFDIPLDMNEHSVAATYDADGDYALYWDGAVVVSGTSPCSDLSGPASSGDRFVIIGNLDFDGTSYYSIDRVMYTDDIVGADQIAAMDAACGEY